MNHIEYMNMAEAEALKSVCKRAQVGAVVAVNAYGGQITGFGHNHNADVLNFGCCEGSNGKTLATVLHAEQAALNAMTSLKVADEPLDLSGAVLYVTRQPCISCAKLIVESGIKQVYYRDSSKPDGILWLLEHGVTVDSRWIQGQIQDREMMR